MLEAIEAQVYGDQVRKLSATDKLRYRDRRGVLHRARFRRQKRTGAIVVVIPTASGGQREVTCKLDPTTLYGFTGIEGAYT